MFITSCTFFLVLLAVHQSVQTSNPMSSTYRAAVVEYKAVFYSNESAKTLTDNAEKFIDFIEQAAKKDVDIIVFPELGLSSLIFVNRAHMVARSTVVPDHSQNYTPCTNSSVPVHEALKMISCAAEQNRIYVVVNLLEKEVCSENDCRSDGIFLYVTSVTFDRQGKIVARYRKGHLPSTLLLDVMKTPEISTFDTDFGVTFGNIICFDIMYEYPWLTLTRKLNITDFIFSSGWYAEMPFLTTIQMEAGWAYVEDVNLLASGHNYIDWANSGSGIYAGRQGVLTAVLPLADHEEMLIADVQKKSTKTGSIISTPQRHNEDRLRSTNEYKEYRAQHAGRWALHSDSFGWKYDKLDGFASRVIHTDSYTTQKLNHIGVECEFQVNVTDMSSPVTYRLLAYDDVRYFGNIVPLGTRVCAIVQCANDTVDSCGHISISSATFNSITITATYLDNLRTVLMPSTLKTDMLPIEDWTFVQYKQEDHVFTRISLTKPTQHLVTFGIWGRNFEKDTMNSTSENSD